MAAVSSAGAYNVPFTRGCELIVRVVIDAMAMEHDDFAGAVADRSNGPSSMLKVLLVRGTTWNYQVARTA